MVRHATTFNYLFVSMWCLCVQSFLVYDSISSNFVKISNQKYKTEDLKLNLILCWGRVQSILMDPKNICLLCWFHRSQCVIELNAQFAIQKSTMDGQLKKNVWIDCIVFIVIGKFSSFIVARLNII